MKKPISIILIIATIISIAFGIFLYKPQKTQAGLIPNATELAQFIKDYILDGLVKPVARHMMVRLQQEIGRWAQGGFSDENKPFAMTSWKDELKGIANVAGGRIVSEFNLTPLCAPIKVSLGTALGFNMPSGNLPYTQYAACTIQDVVDNVEEFYKNPSISVYGWDSWTALTQPNNNFLGSALMALERKEEITEEETAAKEKEIEAGQGVKNETICNQTDVDACERRCENDYASDADIEKCYKSCEKSSTGVCLQETTKKLGSEIKTSVDKAIGSDMDWLISADEITEMLDLVFSGLFNKLINGANGLMTKAFYKTDSATKNFDYTYYKEFKKSQTPEDIKKIKTDILQNILNSVKSVSTAGYNCEEDRQFKSEVYQEVNAEILDQEAQHLYTATEGIDLKPDFIVLDSQVAVNNGIAMYGVEWNDIAFKKYPEKCASIANSKCSNIITGLPYELDINNINSECNEGCLARINELRATGSSDADSATTATNEGKCSSVTIGQQCLNGGYLIDRTKTYCDECTKKYQDSCEFKETPEEIAQCLESYCGNYKDISSSIKTPQDFYNRCAKREIKYNCEVCLKEYFMPAEYCGQVNDYISRAYMKYPGLIYLNTWYGPRTNVCSDAPSDTTGYIPTALTCRIMPDFKFPSGGTCEKYCPNTTADELKDITDNKPSELDCTGPQKTYFLHPGWGAVWFSGGRHPGVLWGHWLSAKKAKCCGALLGHMTEDYLLCRGASVIEPTPVCTFAKSVDQEPWCYCNDGYRPLGYTRTGGTQTMGSYGGDCSNTYISTYGNEIYIYSNNKPDSDTFFLGKSGCSETDERVNNTDINDDGIADNIATDAIAPSSTIWEQIPEGKSNWTLSDIANGDYTAGAYHNSNDDVASGIHVCEKCNPSDPNYRDGYYGTVFDQCGNKI